MNSRFGRRRINPDNHYLNTTIDGRFDYLITGKRGTVQYLSFGSKSGGYESNGRMDPTGQIEASEMQFAADGSFELHVSSSPKLGNMLFRWIDAKDHPAIATRVVKLNAL